MIGRRFAWFSLPPGRRLLAKLAQLGIDPPGTVIAAGAFTGKTFVLTGTLPTLKREEAEQQILAAGGKTGGFSAGGGAANPGLIPSENTLKCCCECAGDFATVMATTNRGLQSAVCSIFSVSDE